MANLDARDALTVLLTFSQRKTGIRIEERRFAGMAPLYILISDVRADLQALDGQLARIEAQAGEERKRELDEVPR